MITWLSGYLRRARAVQRAARRVLAVVAVALGVLAAVAGPRSDRRAAAQGPAEQRHAAEEPDARAQCFADLMPLELAALIRDGKRELRVVDLRSADEFDDARVPTAESVDLKALSATHFGTADTVVLYANETTVVARACALLRTAGFHQVFSLRGGYSAWTDEVLHPTLRDGANTEEQAAFARAAELCRYFGGTPRRGPREPPKAPPYRRGC